MEQKIKTLIESYKALYNKFHSANGQGATGDVFTSSDMEYLDTLGMMIDDLEELLKV